MRSNGGSFGHTGDAMRSCFAGRGSGAIASGSGLAGWGSGIGTTSSRATLSGSACAGSRGVVALGDGTAVGCAIGAGKECAHGCLPVAYCGSLCPRKNVNEPTAMPSSKLAANAAGTQAGVRRDGLACGAGAGRAGSAGWLGVEEEAGFARFGEGSGVAVAIRAMIFACRSDGGAAWGSEDRKRVV